MVSPALGAPGGAFVPARRCFLVTAATVAASAGVALLAGAAPTGNHRPGHQTRGRIVDGALRSVAAELRPALKHVGVWSELVGALFQESRAYPLPGSEHPFQQPLPSALVVGELNLVLAPQREVLGSRAILAASGGEGLPDATKLISLSELHETPLARVAGGAGKIEAELRQGRHSDALRLAQQRLELPPLDVALYHAQTTVYLLAERIFSAQRATPAQEDRELAWLRGLVGDVVFGAMPALFAQRPAALTAASPGPWETLPSDRAAGPAYLERLADALGRDDEAARGQGRAGAPDPQVQSDREVAKELRGSANAAVHRVRAVPAPRPSVIIIPFGTPFGDPFGRRDPPRGIEI
ncbi:MAG: hypothetical protein IPL40_07715 [Proteobacteria bacterium]|nr:hypothetical protein [Pseudomonadota bacterium]